MLSNAYFLAKFRFDTAENEPAKNLQILQRKCKILQNYRRRGVADLLRGAGALPGHLAEEGLEDAAPGAPDLAKKRRVAMASALSKCVCLLFMFQSGLKIRGLGHYQCPILPWPRRFSKLILENIEIRHVFRFY